MKILLDSGVMRYINILFFLSLLFALFASILGFVFFIFFTITFLSIYGTVYLFRYEDRIISNGELVSPADGNIIHISNLEILPDIITNYKNYNHYTCLIIQSSFNNIYFKHAPCGGVIKDIKILAPKSIDKKSNFLHKSYKQYIIIEILTNNNENIFLIIEAIFADENYNCYYLYVEKDMEVIKGQILICVHFYSKLFFLFPTSPLKVQNNQSLLYKEISIV